jgi:glutamate-ammonia-ligase adenylyltransferase
MLVYDHPDEVSESRGNRRMPVSQWFVRAAHSYVAAVTAPGVDGPMYEVDMRLRPSGNKGPVAVSLGSFRRYHAEAAWTWERMALTRARVVAGPPAMRGQVRQAIDEAIRRGQEPAKIRENATTMRNRMARDLRPQGVWDVKLRPGGLIDIEFIAQVLQLVRVQSDPGFRTSQTTHIALKRLSAAGMLDKRDAGLLIQAERLWRTIQGMLRMTVGRVEAETLPPASAALLLRAAAEAGVTAAGTEDLLRQSDTIAQHVRAIFEQHVGKVGA